MDKFNQLKRLMEDIEIDVDKFYNKGNSAAGTRVRKGMQEMKALAQAIRMDVQSKKSAK